MKGHVKKKTKKKQPKHEIGSHCVCVVGIQHLYLNCNKLVAGESIFKVRPRNLNKNFKEKPTTIFQRSL